nr:DKNYY domain-containing protein [uncultured Achromobacter sp.]
MRAGLLDRIPGRQPNVAEGPPGRSLMQKRTRWIGIVLALVIAGLPMSLLIFVLDDDPYAAADKGESYRASIYKRYQGVVYAAVPSNGYYRMDEADPASFKPFDTPGYDGRQAARDARHVYCGNRILPGMSPASTRYLGNSYFGDGSTTYYCSLFSVVNPDLSPVQEVWQTILFGMGRGAKPQNYRYPFKALPASAQPYRALLDRDLATDGAKVFYRGSEVPQANPDTFRRLPASRDGRQLLSDDFFGDGRHVYFHEALLPLADDPGLRAFKVGELDREPYLYDPRDGMVYVGAHAFDAAHAPYRLLSEGGQHVKQALFAGRDGIYFYNVQKRRMERAGDDPFASGGFTALSPFVFSDGKQVLFLKGSESWSSSRGGGGLISRSTLIKRLKDAPGGEWKKLGDVYHQFGSVWQNGDQRYYLDQTGSSQLVFSPIYRIMDRETTDFLLRSQQTFDIKMDDIRKLIRAGKLAAPASDDVLEAKVRYRGFLSWF